MMRMHVLILQVYLQTILNVMVVLTETVTVCVTEKRVGDALFTEVRERLNQIIQLA